VSGSDSPTSCIPGCTANHTTQPPGLRECTATETVGSVRSSVAGQTPAHVSVTRWQDPTGTGAEVVVHGPERDGEPAAEPMTFIPAQARDLSALLARAADLAE
jgi:hypothetical protein